MATPWKSEEERKEYFCKQSIAQHFAKELKSRCVKRGIYPAFVEAMANEILKEIEEGKFHDQKKL